MNDPRVGKLLATSVKYFYVFLYPWLGADLCFIKVYDDVFRVGFGHLPPIRWVPQVPPESPHARDRMVE